MFRADNVRELWAPITNPPASAQLWSTPEPRLRQSSRDAKIRNLCRRCQKTTIRIIRPATLLGPCQYTIRFKGSNRLAAGVRGRRGDGINFQAFLWWVSDKLGKRKALTVIGYGLGALSKPLFALAPTSSLVLAARFSDRVGKGIRGAPRDAMVGDMVPGGLRGAAYGLRQALDTVGAFAGPLIAIALMATLHDNFRLIFWLALIPGLISVLVLLVAVREPPHEAIARQTHLKFRDLRNLGVAYYWIVVAIGAVLTLARFSEAFLILRAQSAGLSLALAPLVLVIMNIVYSLSAYRSAQLRGRF